MRLATVILGTSEYDYIIPEGMSVSPGMVVVVPGFNGHRTESKVIRVRNEEIENLPLPVERYKNIYSVEVGYDYMNLDERYAKINLSKGQAASIVKDQIIKLLDGEENFDIEIVYHNGKLEVLKKTNNGFTYSFGCHRHIEA